MGRAAIVWIPAAAVALASASLLLLTIGPVGTTVAAQPTPVPRLTQNLVGKSNQYIGEYAILWLKEYDKVSGPPTVRLVEKITNGDLRKFGLEPLQYLPCEAGNLALVILSGDFLMYLRGAFAPRTPQEMKFIS